MHRSEQILILKLYRLLLLVALIGITCFAVRFAIDIFLGTPDLMYAPGPIKHK